MSELTEIPPAFFIQSHNWTGGDCTWTRLTVDINLDEIKKQKGQASKLLETIYDPIYDTIMGPLPDIEHLS